MAGLAYKESLTFTSNSVTESQFWMKQRFIFTYLQTTDFQMAYALPDFNKTWRNVRDTTVIEVLKDIS